MDFFKTDDEKKEQKRLDDKMRRIQNAEPHEKHRKPNPQQGILFQEENFIDFKVIQDNKIIILQTYRFLPQQGVEPKAIVFMFHGLGGHMNNCAHIAKNLTDIGCIVVGFDHRGFGKSQGLRGFLENIQLHLEDSNKFIDMVLGIYQSRSSLPIFLSGLSMGGMTSFKLSIQHPNRFRGIIIYAPAIKVAVSSSVISLASFVGTIMPKFQIIPIKKGQITKNPLVMDDYTKDQFSIKDKTRPGTIKTIVNAMVECEKQYHLLTVPWILIQGGLDKLVDPDVAYLLQSRSPSNDKTVLFYDDLWLVYAYLSYLLKGMTFGMKKKSMILYQKLKNGSRRGFDDQEYIMDI